MRRLGLLGAASALALALAAPVRAAPEVAAARAVGLAQCPNAPLPAQKLGFCQRLVNITNFSNVDYGLTFKPGFDAYDFQAFGETATNHLGTFTASTATNVLTVTAIATGIVAPNQGIPQGIPLIGAGLPVNTFITGQSTSTATTTAAASFTTASHTITLAAGGCINAHPYDAIYDTTVGTFGTRAALVGYVNTCSGTTLTLPAIAGSATTTSAIASSGSPDAIAFGGSLGTYALSTTPGTIAGESMSTPAFWKNPDGSMTVTQDTNTFSATVSLASIVGGTGTNWHGHAIGGPHYTEVVAAYASNTDTPAGPGSWEIPEWETPIEADTQQYTLLTPPGQSTATANGMYVETDGFETFDGLFSNAAHLQWLNLHGWYHYNSASANALVQPFSEANTTLASFHHYGISLSQSAICGFLDGASQGCSNFTPWFESFCNASQSFTTASTTITVPSCPINPVAGMTVIDNTVGGTTNVGTVKSYGNPNGLVTVHCSNLSFTGAGPTVACNAAANIPVGSLVVVFVNDSANFNVGTHGTVADTHSNTYAATRNQILSPAADGVNTIFTSYITTQINSGDAITYTPAATCTSSCFMDIGVVSAAGMTSAGTDGGNSTAYTSGTTTTSGNATGSQAGDLACGMWGSNSGASVTNDPTYTSNVVYTGGVAGVEVAGCKLLSGTPATNYSAALTGSITNGAGLVELFKVNAGGTNTLTLNAASAINSSGSADQLQFVYTPPDAAPWAFSGALETYRSHQNLKIGTGPQNPLQIKSIQVWGPMGSNANMQVR
jgi:hypothetical protein